MHEDKIINVSLVDLVPNPNQPRKVFDETTIDNLANSIRQFGIINPIIVRPNNGKYEIIAGERRYRAAKKLNLEKVPVIVKEIDDIELSEIALIENIMREDLTPIEEANAYQEILNTTNLKESDLARKIGKSQSAISNKIRLLSLPEEIKNALNNRQISERHARSLLKITDSATQIELLNQIIDKKLTVKELDHIIESTLSDEAQINLAISNIMASLKKESQIEQNNQKEEKESDNMNQGSFFPNMNQPTTNNNMSLNAMNIQSMANAQGVNPNIPNSIPTPEHTPSFAMPEMTPSNMDMPSSPTGLDNSNQVNMSVNPTPVVEPLFNIPTEQPSQLEPNATQPLFTPSIEPQVTPTNQVTPESTTKPFISQPPVTEFTPAPQPEVTPAPSIEDLPLFNNIQSSQEPEPTSSLSQPSSPTEEFTTALNPEAPAYEIPVNITAPEPQIAPTEPTNISNEPAITQAETTQELPADKLTQTKEFLDANNISYKLYSNESSHCIIIEL